MPRPSLSVTIITLNEEKNLPRAIESVKWAEDILVVDSGSTDRTVEIARQHGARVIHNPWPGYGKQKNFAQERAAHDWVLSLDADEAVSPELADEIRDVLSSLASLAGDGDGGSRTRGFCLPRKTFYLGRWIRYGGWYPNYIARLAHRAHCSWSEPNVHEKLQINGGVAYLKNALHHYSFSSIEDQLLTNLRFARLGFQDLVDSGHGPSLVKLAFKPLGKFFETYFLKFGFLDGLAGFVISVNAAYSMFLKYAYLVEAKLRGNDEPKLRGDDENEASR